MSERGRTKRIIGLLAVIACLLLVMSYLITNGPAPGQRASSASSELPKNVETIGTPARITAENSNEIVANETGADSTKINEKKVPEISEIKLVPLEEQDAIQLKRTNFEAFIRYQQKLSASNQIEPPSDPEARKLAAEDRVQKRMANLLLAAKGSSK